jgi:hypothetical protein
VDKQTVLFDFVKSRAHNLANQKLLAHSAIYTLLAGFNSMIDSYNN